MARTVCGAQLRQVRSDRRAAVARAALREPGLPAAQLDGLRLQVDHPEDLVAARTRMIS